MDKFTLRGIIYTVIGLLGIGYEFIFSRSTRPIVVLLYLGIIGIGLICIFLIKEKKSTRR